MKPVFSKSLTKTDVKNRLAVPMRSLSSLPDFKEGHTVDLRVRDASGQGKVWKFKCSVRKKNHPKPVFCSGWLDFVRFKDLQIGDQIKFYKDMDDAPGANSYKIKVKKAVRIFGVVFGYVEEA
ncbi:hypothetical protein SLE2022_044570 [Rubroshorea leprosula]